MKENLAQIFQGEIPRRTWHGGMARVATKPPYFDRKAAQSSMSVLFSRHVHVPTPPPPPPTPLGASDLPPHDAPSVIANLSSSARYVMIIVTNCNTNSACYTYPGVTLFTRIHGQRPSCVPSTCRLKLPCPPVLKTLLFVSN